MGANAIVLSEEGEKCIETDVVEKATVILQIFYNILSLIGPVLGGWTFDWKGFTFTTSLVATISLIFTIGFGIVIYCTWDKHIEEKALTELAVSKKQPSKSMMLAASVYKPKLAFRNKRTLM